MPHLHAAGAIDQADGHARARSHRLHFALDQRAGREGTRDRIARHVTPAKRRDAIARHDIQRSNGAQPIDQCLSQTIGEIPQRAVPTGVVDVEHGDTILREASGTGTGSAVTTEQQPGAGDQHDRPDADGCGCGPSPDHARACVPSRRGHARHATGTRRGQRFREFAGCLIAVGGDLLERALDAGLELVGNRIAHDFQSRHGIERVARHDRLRGGAGERRLAGERLVEHTRETVDVAAAIDLPRSRRLLRGHVRRRADREPRLRQLVAAGRADGARDAKVGDDRVPAGQHDVLRLDVAMHHVVIVRVRERFGDLVRDL